MRETDFHFSRDSSWYVSYSSFQYNELKFENSREHLKTAFFHNGQQNLTGGFMILTKIKNWKVQAKKAQISLMYYRQRTQKARTWQTIWP